MDQSLIAEVEAWIADDPDPVTAAQLRQWLDTNNEAELRASLVVFFNLVPLVYVGLFALVLQE